MAMSGTLTASTAGVSVPGGLTHPPRNLDRDCNPSCKSCLLQEANGLSVAQLCFAKASSGSLEAAQPGVEKPSRPLPLRETQDTPPPLLSRQESHPALPQACCLLPSRVPSHPRRAVSVRMYKEACTSLLG